MKLKKTIIFIGWMLIILGFMSCSAGFHYKQTVKKDPDFFDIDTTTIRTNITIPPVTTSIDCDSISTDPVVITLPSITNTRVDTVTITIFKKPNGKISATVDCPDSEIITKMVPEPYPVYVQPSLKTKIRFAVGGLFGCIVIIVLIWIIRKIAGF